MKLNENFKNSIQEDRKKRIIKELIENPKIKKIIEKEKITKEEFDINMSMFLQAIEPNEDFNITIKRNKEGNLEKIFLPTELKKQKEIEKHLWLSQISKIDRSLNIIDILNDGVDNQKENYDSWYQTTNLIYKNKNIYKNNKGIYIQGSYGIGKTHFAQAIINSFIKSQTVAFINTSELYSFLKANFKDPDNKNADIIDKMKKVDVLLLDDIGAEPISPWFRDGILLPVLSSRMNHNLLTFFTSNYTIKNLEFIQAKNPFTKDVNMDKENAKRLIERIKFLATEINWKGKNLRN